MFEAIRNALSGLVAAQNRMFAVADNVANANDESRLTPQAGDPPTFQPLMTVETSNPGGGVTSRLAPVQPATVTVPDSQSPFANAQGLVALPNVDIGTQMVDMIMAKNSFTANAKVLTTAAKMQDELLSIGSDKKGVDIKV